MMKIKEQLLSLPDLNLVIDYNPLIVTPNTLLSDVVAIMSEQESNTILTIKSLTSDSNYKKSITNFVVVTEALSIKGLFTSQDVVRLVAAGQDLAVTKIAEVMTQEMLILKQSDCEDINKILSLFREYQLSYLLVADEFEQLVGVITPASICKALKPLNEHSIIGSYLNKIDITEDQQNELSNLEEILRLHNYAIASSPSGIVICNPRLPDCPIIYVNPAFERITGYSAPEVIGKNCRFLQGKDTNQLEVDVLRNAIQVGKECHVVLQNYRKDGTVFWNDLKIVPVRDPHGNLTHYIGIQTDITVRKQAEAALEQTQEQLRAVLDGVPGLVSWISSDLKYIGVNKQLAARFNYPPEAFVDQEVGFLECSPHFKEIMRRFFASPAKEFSQEIPTNVNGDVHSYLIMAQKYDRDRAAFSVGIDITNRIRVEEALRATTSRLTTLIKNLQAGILLKDESKRIVLINEAFCTMFDINALPQQLIGLDFSDFTDKYQHYFVSPKQFVQSTKEICKIKQVVTNEELYLKDGRIFERDYVPIFVEDNYSGHLWIYRDITERKQAEMALLRTQHELRQALAKEKELSDLKSRFVSMTSHEFRTPLSTILSSAELLEHYRHQWTEEKQLKHLYRIQASVKHMTQLLNDVLVIGKTEVGQFSFKPTTIDLVDFCRTLVEEIQLSGEIQHQIILSSNGEAIIAFIDEKILRQILSNLLSNAIKYSPNTDTVKLSLNLRSAWILLQVQDYGIGIPQEDQHHLFESFHRGTNVGNIPGTGLGLAIVKKCVDFCKGKVTVVSEVGVGTTFTVTLPLNPKF